MIQFRQKCFVGGFVLYGGNPHGHDVPSVFLKIIGCFSLCIRGTGDDHKRGFLRLFHDKELSQCGAGNGIGISWDILIRGGCERAVSADYPIRGLSR